MASILMAICTVWLNATEAWALRRQQLSKAQKAEILLRALAETGIIALIDAVIGYEKDKSRNAVFVELGQRNFRMSCTRICKLRQSE